MAGELVAESPAGEVGELALLAEVGVPQVARGDPLQALPEAALLGAGVEVVEVRVEVRLEQLGDRLADPAGPWIPLVRPMISWSVMPCHVASPSRRGAG